MPPPPSWPRNFHSVDFGGRTYDIFFRNIISCLKAIWSDPELSPYLILAPERHYADKDKTIRLYFDMHTEAYAGSS